MANKESSNKHQTNEICIEDGYLHRRRLSAQKDVWEHAGNDVATPTRFGGHSTLPQPLLNLFSRRCIRRRSTEDMLKG